MALLVLAIKTDILIHSLLTLIWLCAEYAYVKGDGNPDNYYVLYERS